MAKLKNQIAHYLPCSTAGIILALCSCHNLEVTTQVSQSTCREATALQA